MSIAAKLRVHLTLAVSFAGQLDTHHCRVYLMFDLAGPFDVRSSETRGFRPSCSIPSYTHHDTFPGRQTFVIDDHQMSPGSSIHQNQ